MTVTPVQPLDDTLRMSDAAPRIRWHRPLLALAVAMAVLAVVSVAARFVDPVEISGVNGWDKPLKFAVSTVIYCVTWSWLIGQLDRGRRVASAAGLVITVMFVIEIGIIVGAAAAGTTSHFNVSSPLATVLWAAMAVSITVLWVATLVVAVILFRSRLGDAARTLAIRSGAVISLVGLGLGFLMTSPTAQQLADFRGIAGAHTVGIADGGPGIPILGWSTVAGDLRIPHFIGMHALQGIPLALIAIELLSRRVIALRDVRVRARLVIAAAAGYAAMVALVTWQALRGQSIVEPDAATLAAASATLLAVATSAVTILVSRGRVTASTGSADQ